MAESRGDALARRRRQSQDAVLDRLTLHRTDYSDGADGQEELRGDVRGLVKCHGLAILRGALSEREVDMIRRRADATRRLVCNTLEARKIPYNSPVNDTETVCFQELAVRCQGRMDVRYCDNYHKHKTSPHNDSKPPATPLSFPLIDDLAAATLHGAEAPNLVYAGWIFSFPGSADQPWHQDGSPLFEQGTESLPSYALNVFCGLHADQLLELGPTEFVIGSHHMRAEQAMGETRAAVSAVLGKGDILLYDYRICHRGTSNLSTTSSPADEVDSGEGTGVVRQVLYLMYARPWFREHLNFGNKRLFG